MKNFGLYVTKKHGIFSSTIIPQKGSWLSIKIKEDNEIYVKLDTSKKKLPVILFLKSFGLSLKKIFFSIKNKKILIDLIKKEKKISIESAIKKTCKLIFNRSTNLMRNLI